MRTALGLDTLNILDDGRLVRAFEVELKRLVQDCVDRPGDANVRKLTMELTLTPQQEADGSCELATAEVAMIGKIPPRRSKSYQVAVTPNGKAIINPANNTNIAQGTLDELNDNMDRGNGEGKKPKPG
ncbi:MAG: hypothetical protein ACREJO_03490 [Phycisphaerales bacterium]